METVESIVNEMSANARIEGLDVEETVAYYARRLRKAMLAGAYENNQDEALVAECSMCSHYRKNGHHCSLNDSLTNPKYKCNNFKFRR